ncbi:MAG: 4Fe-4S cluster-binding domain-containing protein, partial [Planctomycetes bacterium]|nr:4Fe-4S cluster-binding domain-containing protein [Planctomycetota bacterium]
MISTISKRPYQLLPFNFRRLRSKVLLVNQVGQYEFVTNDEFKQVYNYELKLKDNLFKTLKSKHFLIDTSIETPIKMLSLKYRTKKNFLQNFTALHMIVATLRCDHHCNYCHASIVSEDKMQYDMSKESATKAVDLILKSPSKHITIEFQGGEPLLNFDIIKLVVDYSKKKNKEI